MAAPINFGQLQQDVLKGIWFCDIVNAPKKTKALLEEIAKELDRVKREKTELELGGNFKTALNKIKQDFERESAALAEVRAEAAKILADAEKEAAAGRLEIQGRTDALDIRQAQQEAEAASLASATSDLERREAGLTENLADLEERERALEHDREALMAAQEKLKADRAAFEQAVKDFRDKMPG